MSRMPTGRYLPGDSPLHRMNAAAKLGSFLVLLAAVVMTDSLLGYGLIIAVSLTLISLSGIGLRAATASIGRLWSFFLVIFLMNTLFFTSEGSLWSWWIFSVSPAGVRQGCNVVLRVALLMVLSNLLSATTPPLELTAALEGFLAPLKLLRVPTGDVAMILGVAIQFIPTLIEETDMIRMAQTARGAQFESRHLREKAASLLPLVVPIFLSAFRRADELATAMEARGYRRSAGRSRRPKIILRLPDMAAVALSCAVCAAQLWVF